MYGYFPFDRIGDINQQGFLYILIIKQLPHCMAAASHLLSGWRTLGVDQQHLVCSRRKRLITIDVRVFNLYESSIQRFSIDKCYRSHHGCFPYPALTNAIEVIMDVSLSSIDKCYRSRHRCFPYPALRNL